MKLFQIGKKMICKWIEAAAYSMGYKITKLNSAKMESIIDTIIKRFTNNENKSDNIWEDFVNDASLNCEHGWEIACEFATNEPILFFREKNIFFGYSISSTKNIKHILCECPGFEFYITNKSVSFAICFNHHNYLIAVVESKKWLREKIILNND
jgi:hypothetical protein